MDKSIVKELVKLDLTRGLSPKQRINVLTGLDNPANLSVDELSKRPGFAKIKLPSDRELNYALTKIAQLEIKLIPFTSPDYPPLLLELKDPPFIIYARGNISRLNSPLCAIVGTRTAHPLAEQWSFQMGKELAQKKVGVISGGARGIDSAALSGALAGQLPPIAVLGVPSDQFYPPEEASLQQEILAHDGLILSEYAPGRTILKVHFLARNRLIAALSKGVVVSAAGIPSGALSTAAIAAKLGRPLMALPLSPWETISLGNVALLRGGAKAVINSAQIIEEIFNQKDGSRNLTLDLDLTNDCQPTKSEEPSAITPEPAPQLSPNDQAILTALSIGPLLLEELINITGQSMSALADNLLALELDGFLSKKNDGRYYRHP